jgi:hypothetical protein
VVLLVLWLDVSIDVGQHLGPGRRWHWQGVVFSVLGVGIAALGWQARALKSRLMRVLLGVLLAALVGSSLVAQSNQVRRIGTSHQVQLWGTFHYWIGARYFEELGYHDLYTQVLVADKESNNHLAEAKLVRNLLTYKREKADLYRNGPRLPTWTDARWEEFKTDVGWFTKRRKPIFWANIIVDRGYNPSPAWHAVGGSMARLLDVKVPWQQTLLMLFDPLLLLAAFGLSVRAWGWTRSLLVLFAFVSWFGNAGRIYGQIFIYDWFAAAWAGLACWRLGWPLRAGLLIGYATMVRVFPVLLLLGPVVVGVWGLVAHRKLDRELLRLGIGALLMAFALFIAGSVSTGRGIAAWGDFLSNVTHHSEEHAFGSKRLGMKHALGFDFKGGLKVKPDKRSNRKNVPKNKGVARALQLLAFLLFGLAVRRANRHDLLLLGLPLMFFLTVASRYYGSIWVLLLLLGVARGGHATAGEEAVPGAARPMARQLFDVFLFAIGVLFYSMPDKGAEAIHQYMYTNVLIGGWLLLLLGWPGLVGWGDPSASSDQESDGGEGGEPQVPRLTGENDVPEAVVEYGDHGPGAAEDRGEGGEPEGHGHQGLQVPAHGQPHAEGVEHPEHEGEGSDGE